MQRAHWFWLAAWAVALAPLRTATAQESAGGDTGEGQPSTQEAVGRVLTTADQAVPETFAFWVSPDGDGFIKPVLQIGSTLVTYVPHSDSNPELATRVSTLVLARFGLEGQLFQYVSFRSVFERNVGFSLGRNGPVGTSVWEGTASLQARENYIRLARWGFSLAGGIVPDPASLDFISENILDTFGADPYVRDPLLVSGFNQGQGFLLNYTHDWLTAGFSYSAGNPLVSSLAFSFGGDVSSLGTLFTAPLRALSNGVPGSDIQMHVLSPSLCVHTDPFDLKLAAQFYLVDVNVASDADERINGYNLRATTQVTLLDDMLRIFASAAYRKNQQLDIPDLTSTRPAFEGLLFGGGADFRWHELGIGGTYYWIRSTLSTDNELTNQYVNAGLTYWLFDPNVSVGARYARSMADSTSTPPQLKATDSFIVSLRLLI